MWSRLAKAPLSLLVFKHSQTAYLHFLRSSVTSHKHSFGSFLTFLGLINQRSFTV